MSLWPRAEVELPSGLTPHLIVPPGKKSGCLEPEHHGLCAFDGTEPDRCPICHRGLHEGPCELKPAENECGACHVVLGTLELFDAHRGKHGEACKRPEDMGLVQDERGTWHTVRGLARRRADAERLRAKRGTAPGAERLR
jgi:hypothetical protein